ncbi:MAG: response regulator transcription factor [Bacillales bacterium]|nr:response regulator transcription factor [Bacillales bacterium]
MVLIIEDDLAIRSGLEYFLKEEGFNVITKENGISGIECINNDIELVLLDINLPDIDGYEVFKKIKKIKDIPIIFLTANDLEVSIVRGLDMGADDYITKPFKARELVSRMKKALRKKVNDNYINIKNIKIDLREAKVYKDDKEVFLTSLEYKILITMALSLNKVFTREKILSDIWDINEDFVNDNTLTVYIKRLREKIETDPSNPEIIKTIRGIGYMIGDKDE